MNQPISGHVSRYEGKRRSVWRAKYRLPDGHQVKKTVGPAWTVETVIIFSRVRFAIWPSASISRAAQRSTRSGVSSSREISPRCGSTWLRKIRVRLADRTSPPVRGPDRELQDLDARVLGFGAVTPQR